MLNDVHRSCRIVSSSRQLPGQTEKAKNPSGFWPFFPIDGRVPAYLQSILTGNLNSADEITCMLNDVRCVVNGVLQMLIDIYDVFIDVLHMLIDMQSIGRNPCGTRVSACRIFSI